jgi:type I restriction enzyme R subunit
VRQASDEFPEVRNESYQADFFRPMKIDRNYEKMPILTAVQYIEPIDRRDDFKSLLKDFNKSINIVLPNTKVLKYQGDFKLFNEIKLRARNAFPDDDELKITKEENASNHD